MRELSLLETGALAVGLLLSLVQPLLISVYGPRNGDGRRYCLKVVWMGQVLLAIAGLGVMGSSALAPYAVGLGVAGWAGCAGWMLGRLRSLGGTT